MTKLTETPWGLVEVPDDAEPVGILYFKAKQQGATAAVDAYKDGADFKRPSSADKWGPCAGDVAKAFEAALTENVARAMGIPDHLLQPPTEDFDPHVVGARGPQFIGQAGRPWRRKRLPASQEALGRLVRQLEDDKHVIRQARENYRDQRDEARATATELKRDLDTQKEVRDLLHRDLETAIAQRDQARTEYDVAKSLAATRLDLLHTAHREAGELRQRITTQANRLGKVRKAIDVDDE